MVVALVLVVFALVGWVVAGRVVALCAALGRRTEGATLVLDRPPVPASDPEPTAAVAPAWGALERKVVLMPPVPVPRPVRRCGNCRAVGHTRPSCPRLTGALPLPML